MLRYRIMEALNAPEALPDAWVALSKTAQRGALERNGFFRRILAD
jgi:hypothetical protein